MGRMREGLSAEAGGSPRHSKAVPARYREASSIFGKSPVLPIFVGESLAGDFWFDLDLGSGL